MHYFYAIHINIKTCLKYLSFKSFSYLSAKKIILTNVLYKK